MWKSGLRLMNNGIF